MTHLHLEGLIRKWREEAKALRDNPSYYAEIRSRGIIEAKEAAANELEEALAALPGGGVDDYEAKYATAERLAKPAATEHCDFCGARPSDLHAYDCTALDEERQSQLLLPDEKLFAGAARDHHHGYVSGWNECLHRVVAMNQRGGK